MKGKWNSISVDLLNKTASARICLHALATKNDVDGVVKEKKMLLKSAKNYDSDPWFLTHLSVLLLWKTSEIQYPSEFYFQVCVLTICGNAKDCTSRSVSEWCQGAKKIIFTACHAGKLKLASTSLDVILTSPKNLLTSRIDFTVVLLFKFLKKPHLPIGQVKNRIHQPDSKIHKPWAIGQYFLCTLNVFFWITIALAWFLFCETWLFPRFVTYGIEIHVDVHQVFKNLSFNGKWKVHLTFCTFFFSMCPPIHQFKACW